MEQVIKSKPIQYSKFIVLKKTNQGLPKGHWWTVDINEAMQFNLLSAAKAKAKLLKYDPCKVIPASQFDKYVGREFWNVEINMALTNEIRAKENKWHDDDWYEGINDD